VDLSGVRADELEALPLVAVARSFDAEYAERYAPLVRLLWSLTGSWAVAECQHRLNLDPFPPVGN
jgi:hypothetical protein